jgi:5-methylcytosine-specific restriction protein A
VIPDNITYAHIVQAIDEINNDGIPPDRHSTKWSVTYDDNLYPPKYLISLANKYANGEEWEPSEFSGGEEANDFLQSLGFKIVAISTRDEYPVESYSWEVLSENVAVKHMDKSSFIHHGTGIPSQIRRFFNITNLTMGDHKEIIIHFNSNRYEAYFAATKFNRTRLFWKQDFEKALQQTLPDWHTAYSQDIDVTDEPPIMRFKRLNEQYSDYEVEIISTVNIKMDIESEIAEEEEHRREGESKYYYGKRYERDPENRSKAIEIHGTSCVVCGFNFESEYGGLLICSLKGLYFGQSER